MIAVVSWASRVRTTERRLAVRAASVVAVVLTACSALAGAASPAAAAGGDAFCSTSGPDAGVCNADLLRQVSKNTAGRTIVTLTRTNVTYRTDGTSGSLRGTGCTFTSVGDNSSQCFATGAAVDRIQQLTYLTVTGVPDADWFGSTSGSRSSPSRQTLLITTNGALRNQATTQYNLAFRFRIGSTLTNDTRSRVTIGSTTVNLTAIRSLVLSAN